MSNTGKPETGATVTGFVDITGGVMNCLNDTTSPINNQAISTTPAPIAKVVASPYLNKPLYCCLKGLLNALDRSSDARITQSVIDCAMFLLIELERIDCEVTYE